MTRFLVVLDVDSTLIQDEVIELIAAHAGLEPQVKAITDAAMRGELDFEASLRQRVGLLAGVPVAALDEVRAAVRVTPGAVELIEAIHERGGAVAAVSGGFAEVLEPLASELGLDLWRANRLATNESTGIPTLSGEVLGPVVTARVKADSLAEWASQLGLAQLQTIAIGDGANDLLMLEAAGLGVAFNAKPRLREAADLVLNSPSLRELVPLLP